MEENLAVRNQKISAQAGGSASYEHPPMVAVVALRRSAPRPAAQFDQSPSNSIWQGGFTTFVPPAPRGRIRRSATNSTTPGISPMRTPIEVARNGAGTKA
jgi:hypothetical protein